MKWQSYTQSALHGGAIGALLLLIFRSDAPPSVVTGAWLVLAALAATVLFSSEQ
jgi:hypothetical protein